MYRLMNDYMREINLMVDDATYKKINEYLNHCDTLKKYCVTVNVNRYIIDLTLKEFSIDAAKEHFDAFTNFLQYPYSSMSLRYNEGSMVRYRFATCKENKQGFYCDVIYNSQSSYAEKNISSNEE